MSFDMNEEMMMLVNESGGRLNKPSLMPSLIADIATAQPPIHWNLNSALFVKNKFSAIKTNWLKTNVFAQM